MDEVKEDCIGLLLWCLKTCKPNSFMFVMFDKMHWRHTCLTPSCDAVILTT